MRHSDTEGSGTINRREGFLVGAAVGAALAAATAALPDAAAIRAAMVDGEVVPLPSPPGRRRAALALADELLVELLGGGVDLHRLAGRWVAWARDDGFEADPMLIAGLDHLREFDAPALALPSGSVAAVAAALPAALTGGAPRGMVSGAFHIARLLDPAETTALAAVAVVIAAAAFLEGRRDFVADVVAALRANGAPETMVDAIRAIPRDPRTPPAAPRGATPDPVDAVVWLLWTAHHRPRGVDALRAMAMAGGIAPTVGAVAGALLGARDGIETWPRQWIDGAGEEGRVRRESAERL